MKFIFLFSTIFNICLCIDTDLWAYVISTSSTFENYRHSINSLMMYNFLKKNGVPDERIIAGLSEFHACSAYSYYPGKLHLTENGQILTSCHSEVNIDYKESDFHNFQIIDILKGRSNQMLNNFRKMKSDKNSRIVIMITSHGGENFIKVRGRSVILSDEMNRALNEMYIKERYKEILFVLDTCEGLSLFEYVEAPNIYFVTSSLKHQKAQSYSYDIFQMTPTSDRFTHKLHDTLQEIYKKKNFKSNINDMFMHLQKQSQFIKSDVAIQNNIKREIIFEEFFGNYLNKNNLNINYGNENGKENENGLKIIRNGLDSNFNYDKHEINYELSKMRNKIDEEVLNIKQYTQNDYTFKIISKADLGIGIKYTSENHIPINTLFFLIFLYLIFNLIKS